jgi:phospholipid/cholesterol/gamma-HCH transport system substrate-binding protein
MLKHFEGARLGVFIFLGTVLLVIAIFLIGNKESIFSDNITVKTYFTDVVGLRTGASVRLSGMNIGNVGDIRLIADTTGRVEVTMKIKKDLIQFIRLDSEASIETEGLVGSKIVNISPGSQDMEVVENNGVIKAKAPLSVTRIIEETQGVIGYLKTLTKNLSEIVQKVNSGNGTIGKVVNDEELYYAAVNITKSADSSLVSMTTRLNEITDFIVNLGSGVESIVANVDSSAADIRNLISRVERGEGVIGALVTDKSSYDSIKSVISNLVSTTKLAKEGTESFMENMEALKHNWLFKGYFEERGYWNKDDFENRVDSKIDSLKNTTNHLQKQLDRLEKMKQKIDEMKKQ